MWEINEEWLTTCNLWGPPASAQGCNESEGGYGEWSSPSSLRYPTLGRSGFLTFDWHWWFPWGRLLVVALQHGDSRNRLMWSSRSWSDIANALWNKFSCYFRTTSRNCLQHRATLPNFSCMGSALIFFKPLRDICFPDTTPKISFKIHFKHDYIFIIYFGSILKKYRSF